jgi:hypothetical protein
VLAADRRTLLDDSAAASLFPLCQRRGVAVLAGGVFNSGILAGPGGGATYDYAPAPPGVLARARRMRDACAAPSCGKPSYWDPPSPSLEVACLASFSCTQQSRR